MNNATTVGTGTIDKPLRIAYLINRYPSPSLVFVRREMAALERQGHVVLRHAIRRWDEPLVDPHDVADGQRTTYVLDAGTAGLLWSALVLAVRHPIRLARAVAAAWRIGFRAARGRLRQAIYLLEACHLTRQLKRQRAVWLHAHFGTNSASVAMLTRLLGGPPYSFTVHGPEEFDRPEALHLPEKIRHAELVMGVSQFGRSQLYRWSDPADWHKLHVIHCGVDPAYLELEEQPPVATRRFVSVARLHEQKGTLLLVEAARKLAAEGEAFELVLVGDGPLRTQVEQRVAACQLEDTVRLVGWQSGTQIQEWLRSARALLLPSFAEGLPVVLMEALASYRPVITTYVAGIPELVGPQDCGWLVPAGDIDALVQAMREALAATPEELARLGRAGARRVAQRHDIHVQTARLAAAISQCLQAPASSRIAGYHGPATGDACDNPRSTAVTVSGTSH